MWPSGLRRQTQVFDTWLVSSYMGFLVSNGGVGSNPTAVMFFSFFNFGLNRILQFLLKSIVLRRFLKYGNSNFFQQTMKFQCLEYVNIGRALEKIIERTVM